MAKINDYPNKTFSQLVANADSFVCTNGTSEYNVTIEELFNYHLNVTDHDLSSFVTDAEAHSIAQSEAQTISDDGIAAYDLAHLAAKEHHTSIEISGLAATAASSAITQHLIDANHPSYIDDLNDVNTYGVYNGQVLIYDSYSGWVPGNISGGASTLDDLSDVNTYGVYNGQILIYDSYSGWVPGSVPTGGASSLNDLTDVTVPGPESGPQNDGDVLTWNSGYNQWVPWPASGASGWSGDFSTNDGKYVTVMNGIITNVETFS